MRISGSVIAAVLIGGCQGVPEADATQPIPSGPVVNGAIDGKLANWSAKAIGEIVVENLSREASL